MILTNSGSEDKEKVQVWVYFQNPTNRVFYFLLLRTRPERGDFWQPVTGHVEEDEELEVAALREAKEETQLNFLSERESNSDEPHSKKGILLPIGEPFQFESRGFVITEWSFALKLVVPSSADEKFQFPEVRLDSTEHTAFQWVTANVALQTVRYPSNAQVLKSLLKHLMS